MRSGVLFFTCNIILACHAGERTSRTVPGTGWAPYGYEYFPRDYVDSATTVSKIVAVHASDSVKADNHYGNKPPAFVTGGSRHPASPESVNVPPPPQKAWAKSLCSQNEFQTKRRFAYSKEHGKCYEVGSIGPCKVNMRFFINGIGSEYGKCDCDPNIGYTCGRPLVYSEQDDWCYPVYSQGPCRQTEWFVLDDTGRPLCKPNPCIRVQKLSAVRETDCQHWVFTRGACVETHTRGLACFRHEFLLWDVYDSQATEPRCISLRIAQIHLDNYANKRLDITRMDPELPCLPGQRQTVLRKCQSNFPSGTLS